MANNSSFSIETALRGKLSGLLMRFRRVIEMGIEDMLPAEVIAFDRRTKRASIRPLIQLVTNDGNIISRETIASVPVLQYGSSAGMISCNLVKGDLGWLKSNDRDISIYKQNKSLAAPNTARTHSFSDGIFIPDVMMDFVIASEDLDKFVIQTPSGTVRISLWSDRLKITTPRASISDVSGYTPSDGAILDLNSTTKAFKLPRMTMAQRNAISSPVGGMMVYCTDKPGISSYTDGVGWS